ncbi:transmembrane protein 50B-like [Anopheles albimanus]|uniref:Transmembrane protein 50A n=1 Tax=Anopheles albimanus TaxID=7167 RepID=A0A182FFP9_ANOAL|nr:transmembrane protein 50B-like [Anopheles albimanus]
MSILERIRQGYWFENIPQRTILATLIASLLFFSGWWIIIDTASVYPDSFNFSFYICGILATISFIMVNAVSNEMLHGGSAFTGGILGGSGIKVFLFTGFVLGFTSIIAAIWIMVAEFAVNEARTDKYPGYALLIHNVFIFLSTLIYKFGRQSENDYLASY